MKKIYENWNNFINEEKARDFLKNWKYDDAQHYAEELVNRYGEPDISSDDMLLWEGKISKFTQTYIKDESIPHCCPKPHRDYVYSTMEIDVPEELMEAITKASESIIVDQLKNEVTARCADINANAITLGFVQKLVDGEIEPENSKEEYEKHIIEGIYPEWYKEKEKEEEINERCQKGYKTHPTRKTKQMYGKTYRNCVKAEEGKTRDTYDDEVVKRNKKDRDSDRKEMGLEEKRKKKKKKKKKKDDRCTRIAKRKYDVWPSAYASGAVVKCRQGKIWKSVKENDNIGLNEEFETLLEQEDNKEFSQEERQKLKKIKKELDKASNTHKSQVGRIAPISSKDKKLKKIEKELAGSSKMHKDQADRIRAIIDEEFSRYLNEKKKKKTDYSKEKKSGLHGWFSRAGGKGSKGWVDCNTCRKDKKTGRKKCKPCGRQEGEKRSKYPACRPTPSDCGTRGKGKKWGKKSAKKK
jgi:hypothetical protein